MSRNPNLDSVLRLVLHPFTGCMLSLLFLQVWSSSEPVSGPESNWFVSLACLTSVLFVWLSFSMFGAWYLGSWRRMSSDLKIFIPALGLMAIVGTGLFVLKTFTLWSVLLWCGVLMWVYCFNVFEAGSYRTVGWIAQKMKCCAFTHKRGLKLERLNQMGTHTWGLAQVLKYGMVLVVVTTALDLGSRYFW